LKKNSLFSLKNRLFFFLDRTRKAVIVSFTDITDQKSMYELLEQRMEARTRELEAILKVSQIVNSNLELGPRLKIILEQLRQVIDYAGAGIAKLDGDDFVIVEYWGIVPREMMLGFRSSMHQETGYQKVAVSKTSNPMQTRLRSLMNHTGFGFGLYLFGWLVNWLLSLLPRYVQLAG
jgi:hypothetical protein